jgi:molybdopterin converting factor small subunit
MITVKLFGLLSEYGGPRQFDVDAGNVRKALCQAADRGVDKVLLRGALMFLNDVPLTGATRMRRRLSDGDVLALLTPAGGG